MFLYQTKPFFYLEPNTAKKGQSKGEKETPIAPIAVGVGVSLVVIAILAAFVIYRCRR